mgnify:CR=1 FL=1
MRRAVAALSVALLVGSAFGCRVRRVVSGPAGGKDQQQLSIFVPCGMLIPFHEAISRYRKGHPGVKVKATYDNAAKLVRAIVEKGARPDLLVSPGCCEVGVIERAGLVQPGSQHTLGSYEVVLVVPRGNPAGVYSWADLRKGTVKNISVGDPEHNSIGHYARQGLSRMGLWKAIEPKMIFTEDAVEAYQNVSQGKVQAAFSYLTCPLTSNPEKLSKEKVEIIAKLPADTYDKATVVIATLNTSKNKALASQFVEYLFQPEVQALLEEKGLPNERRAARPLREGAPGARPTSNGAT